jgi:glutamine amidotransferase
MNIVIIDYGSGNLRSAANAFERAALELGLTSKISVTSSAEDVASADRIVLPGVGAFADCKAGLEAVPGLVDALTDVVITKARPFLGICVGMQLMADKGYEHGETSGFGWISGAVTALSPSQDAGPGGAGPRIPHMGWNRLNMNHPHPVLDGLGEDPFFYFVHSYHLACENEQQLHATVNYGQAVTAAVGRDNMFGTQFHPEKSQSLGLKLIANFLQWSP